jgi:hypothetical protein
MPEETIVRWLVATDKIRLGTSRQGLVLVTKGDGEDVVTALLWEQVMDITPSLRGAVIWSDEKAVPRTD